MVFVLKILEIEDLTHDVKSVVLEKPKGFEFIPGQAAHISINQEGLKDLVRPFTFTCTNEDDYLEFMIKRYDSHDGITKKIHNLNVGDELILVDVFGSISYNGPGVFIAGGTGITPFISIFRDLKKREKLRGNKLIFSNKTHEDIFLEGELKEMFGSSLILTLTRENVEGYLNSRVDEKFLGKYIQDFGVNFYLCGPRKMVNDLKIFLNELGADISEVVF